MAKPKVDHASEYVIAVLMPKERTSYVNVMSSVINAIGVVEYRSDRNLDRFVFIHDGVSRGSTGYLIETINKITLSAKQFNPPRTIMCRRMPLDIELHGTKSHFYWVDEIIKLKPDLILAFDAGTNQALIAYAKSQAKKHGVEIEIRRTVKE